MPKIDDDKLQFTNGEDHFPGALESLKYQQLCQSIRSSYEHFLKQPFPIVSQHGKDMPLANTLYLSPFALVSHGLEAEPVFNFGNQVALRLFGYDWDSFIELPSKYSAQAMLRQERQKLLATVSEQGYIDNYSGIRISASGKRFHIHQATVWNLIKPNGDPLGQAAMFSRWTWLPEN